MQAEGLAKIAWDDIVSNERREYVLVEGATASIGRSSSNNICIPERHVSRQHAVIAFRDGIFTISDLGSANGTFVNDKRLEEPFPLQHGDTIRLYVPTLIFSAIVTDEEQEIARKTGTMVVPAQKTGIPKLIMNSEAETVEYPLVRSPMTIGRVTPDTQWDIALPDKSISRPHCRLVQRDGQWAVMDMGSSNGTVLNNMEVGADPRPLKDGDVIRVGTSWLLFRMPQ